VLTPPTGLSSGDLEEVIEQAWGVAVDSLEYRPVGFGSHHWVVTDNLGLRHFVTVDELSSESRLGDEVSVLGLHLRSALTAAIDLRAFGCGFVVAPITTRSHDPLVQFDSYAVALFPFIEGQSFSFEESFGEVDRERILEVVAALHKVPIAAIRPPAADGFVVPWLDQLDRSMQREVGSNGPHAAAASQLLIDNEAEIRRLIARYRTLVAQYLSDPGPVVVTHGEIHPGNVMVTSKGWVVVDWDTVLVAPPERDLWRLAQGGGSVLRAYVEATGTAPNEWLVDLYGIRWDLTEIASFAAEFGKPHEDTADSRKALAILRSVVGRLRA
jgi:spectinomycin phosphotransferase/16S rRNA (guanine(1405)-N(7))-methyltransferase